MEGQLEFEWECAGGQWRGREGEPVEREFERGVGVCEGDDGVGWRVGAGAGGRGIRWCGIRISISIALRFKEYQESLEQRVWNIVSMHP